MVAKFRAHLVADVIKVAQVEGLDRERIIRRVARLLRSEFRNEREAAIGPDLSHRRTLIGAMIREAARTAAIAREAIAKICQCQRVERRAGQWPQIAADYSYPRRAPR